MDKMIISFTFNYYSSDYSWGKYEVTKTASPEDSVRQLALTVIQEAIDSGKDIWTREVNAGSPVQIYIASDDIRDTRTGFERSGFGIKYALDGQGGLIILNDYEPLHYDWKISEIQELLDAGYVKGNDGHFIIGLPEGLGADGDIPSFIGLMAAALQLIDYGYRGARYIKGSFTDKEIRRVAHNWITNGIRYPEQIREFIDTKSEWKTAEVNRRLKLNDEQTYKLLTALGLELKGSGWRLTHSKDSTSYRRKWMRNEKRYHNKV